MYKMLSNKRIEIPNPEQPPVYVRFSIHYVHGEQIPGYPVSQPSAWVIPLP
jgi:hypothetical protein